MRRCSLFATANRYISAHSVAFASSAKNTIAIMSPIGCFTFTCCLGLSHDKRANKYCIEKGMKNPVILWLGRSVHSISGRFL